MFSKKKKPFMTGGAYRVVADAVRAIEDPAIRTTMADHFAKYFHSRSPSFDPQAWFVATGGLVNPK